MQRDNLQGKGEHSLNVSTVAVSPFPLRFSPRASLSLNPFPLRLPMSFCRKKQIRGEPFKKLNISFKHDKTILKSKIQNNKIQFPKLKNRQRIRGGREGGCTKTKRLRLVQKPLGEKEMPIFVGFSFSLSPHRFPPRIL